MALSFRPGMRGNHIDFISAYCDRWCERCAFTDRCSAYAVEVVTGMCDGDFEAAIELAIAPAPPITAREREQREEFLESLSNCEPTPQEMAQIERELRDQEERIDELPITTISRVASLLSHRWLTDHRDAAALTADAALADALAVAAWDSYLIRAKLSRALRGRDAAQRGEDIGDDHPIQNDWNGSAKLALVCIERSIAAWQVIAAATRDHDAAHVAQELGRLQREVEQTFPNARRFIRPGFDR